jgi:hypothetical protein
VNRPCGPYDARRIVARLLAACERSEHPDAELVTVRKSSIRELADVLGVDGYTWEGTAFYERNPRPVPDDRMMVFGEPVE